MSVTFAAAAQRDVRDIFIESARRFGATAALERVERMLEHVDRTLGAVSQSGRARPEFGPTVRSYSIVPYVAFCDVRGAEKRVLRVLHCQRDLRGPLMALLAAC